VSVSRTGSAGYIADPNNSASQSITVPADATIAIVGIVNFRDVDNYIGLGNAEDASTASLTLGGTQMKIGRVQDTLAELPANYHIGLFYLVNPPTGSQTLAWDFAGSNNPSLGSVIHYAFYKGVDISSPIRSRGGEKNESGSSATTGTLAAVAGDAIVAEGCSYANNTVSWTNATELREEGYSDWGQNAAYAENVSVSGDVAVSISATYDYAMIVGMVLKASGGPFMPPGYEVSRRSHNSAMRVGR
jgi:hypothetical protein